MEIITSSGMCSSPSCIATVDTLIMLRPVRHTLRPKRCAESTTCWILWMLEANIAMMMRPSAFGKKELKVSPTVFSDMV